MGYFPFYVDLTDKKCVIIGGGKVAYRKIKVLLDFDADITLISPQIIDEIRELSKDIRLIERAFEVEDIKNAFYVISATNNKGLNELVSSLCFATNTLVNVIDDIEKCNFIFPAVLKKDEITISVSTSGSSPIMSKAIRDNIDENLPEYFPPLVRKLGEVRNRLKNEIDEEEIRYKILNKVSKLALENNGDFDDALVDDIIKGEYNEKNY